MTATTFMVPKNNAATTLSGDINDSTQTVPVVNGAVFPASGTFPILIDSEIMLCTVVNGNNLTVTRAQEDTAAAAHTSADAVTLIWTAKFVSDINTAINTIEALPGAVSGLATLNASSKVVEQPASISNFLEDTPSNGEVTKAPTSNAFFDHVAAADPHSVYRLESADHTHATTGAQGGQIDHGNAMVAASLLDDDHTQYILKSVLTEKGDIFYASGVATPAALAHGDAGQKLKTGGHAAIPSWVDDFASINFIIDGGGAVVATGQKGHVEVPFACTIVGVTILADQSGSAVVDIWKDTYANFPPADADSITSATPPTITTATKAQDTTLTSWTTAIAAGDILAFNVDSCTTCTRLTIAIKVKKT